MCNKFMIPKSSLTPTAVKLAKITLILIFFCFAECAAGSCISYGHSCWGAHGKRNNDGTNRNSIPMKSDLTVNDLPNDTKWFLSRLLQTPETRFFKNQDTVVVPLPSTVEKQFLKDISDGEDIKSLEDSELTDYQEGIESMFPEGHIPHSKTATERLRFLKFLKNNAGK